MIDRLVSLWGSPRRPALLGLLLFFCAGFADGALVPFFPLWARDEAGIPVCAIGLLFGCYAGGELVAAPLSGGIADRIGRRPVLIGSSLGVASGFVALFFAHGVALSAGILLLTGMCESVLHPTISTVIADVTPRSAHHRWFSLVRVSSSAGQVLGPAVAALLALLSPRRRRNTSAGRPIDDNDYRALTFLERLRVRVHGMMTAYTPNADRCLACGLCVVACP